MGKLDFPLKLHEINRITGSHTIIETHSVEELSLVLANITRIKGSEMDALIEQILTGERLRINKEYPDQDHLDVELYASKHGQTEGPNLA